MNTASFCRAIGCAGQGEFTDRFGRKAVYQFNLLLFGLATIASPLRPDYIWFAAFRFLSGSHFVRGACSWR